jgi:hypothetical protein
MDNTPARVADDPVARMVAVVGLMGIALIHLLDVFSKFRETPYLGFSYVALIIACLLAVGLLLAGRSRQAWMLAAAAAALPLLAYCLSRTTGLPASSGDIGNWEEPLGVASLFIEGSLLLLSIWALSSVTKISPRLRLGQQQTA